jgi:drug/metabolite transporter (DMT)-like permease
MVAASALLFATKAIVVKCAYPYGIGALDLLTLRMGFSLPVFLLVAWHEERRAATRLSAGDLCRCCGLGIMGYYLASFLDFEGLRFIGVGLERMVLYVYPTVVVVIGVLAWGHRVTGRLVVALLTTYVEPVPFPLS